MRVPVYQQRLDPQSPGVPVVPGGAGAIGDAIGHVAEALGGVADRAYDVAQRRADADRTITAITTTAAAMRELDDISAAYAESPDYANAETKYREAAGKVAEGYVQRFGGDELRAAQFRETVGRLSSAGALRIREQASRKRTDAGVASLDDVMARARVIAATGNSAERDTAVKLVDDGIDSLVRAGVLTAEAGGKRMRDFTSDVDEADVMQGIRVDPRQTTLDLADPGQYPGLTPIARERQLRAAQSRADSLDSERERNQARADRESDKRLAGVQDETARQMYGLAADGQLDRAWLDGNRRNLSPAEYRAGIEALNKTHEPTDDPDVVMELESRIDREDIAPLVHRAAADQLISTPMAQKMLDKNRSLRGDDKPASIRKRGREYTLGVLGGEGTTFNDPVITGQVARRKAEALDELDVWFDAHPQATPEEARDFYRGLAERAQAMTLGDVELSLVAPRYAAGARSDMSLETLDQAERRALAEFDANRLGKSELALELGRIGDWRRVVAGRPKKPPTTGGKP